MATIPTSILGLDYSWLAVDDRGHVGFFTSAGEGSVPASALNDLHLEALIQAEPVQCECTLLLIDMPIPNDYENAAARGIYAFDWGEAGSLRQKRKGVYGLAAVPERPISVESLPPALRSCALATRLHGVHFGASADSGIEVQ